MAKLVFAFIIGLLLVTRSAAAQNPTPLISKELASRTVYRRAVDAVIWGVAGSDFGHDAAGLLTRRQGKLRVFGQERLVVLGVAVIDVKLRA